MTQRNSRRRSRESLSSLPRKKKKKKRKEERKKKELTRARVPVLSTFVRENANYTAKRSAVGGAHNRKAGSRERKR